MEKQSLTITDIRSKYSEEKREADRDDPWLYFVMRPISFYPTWLFLKLGISANQTTLMGFMIGIVGLIFLASGAYWAMVVGAVLINTWFLLDVVDGNIARYTNSCTTYGGYIDKISGQFILGIVFIAIGISLYSHPDPYLNYLSNLLFGIDVNINLYLLLGILCSLFMTSRFLVTEGFGLTFSTKPRDFYKPKVGFERSIWGLIYTFGVGLENMVLPILLVTAIANILSIFIALWTLITACDVITVTALTLTRARKIDRATNK